MLIVWSDIVARTTWRLARSVDKVNGARKMVNKEVSGFVVRNGGLAIRHMVLEVDTWRYLRRDGVHLNDVGFGNTGWDKANIEGLAGHTRVRLYPGVCCGVMLVFAGEGLNPSYGKVWDPSVV